MYKSFTSVLAVFAASAYASTDLCNPKGAADTFDWYHYENLIKARQGDIDGVATKVADIKLCEEKALTAWKSLNEFFPKCPQTQSSATDWKEWIPSAELKDLPRQAQDFTISAEILEKAVIDIKDQQTDLKSKIVDAKQDLTVAEAALAKMNEFQSYYNGCGDTFAEVLTCYDTQQTEFTTNIDAAKKLIDDAQAVVDTAVKELNDLQTTLTDKTKEFDDKVVELRVDLDQAVTDTTKVAQDAINDAKTAYDDLNNSAVQSLADAKSAYQTALDGLAIGQKEIDYQTKYKDLTSAAQQAFDTKEGDIADAQSKLEKAKDDLETAQSYVQKVTDYGTCVSETNTLFLKAETDKATDKTMYETALNAAKDQLKEAEEFVAKIADLTSKVEAAQKVFDDEELLLPQLQTDLEAAIENRDKDTDLDDLKTTWETARDTVDTVLATEQGAIDLAEAELEGDPIKEAKSKWDVAEAVLTNSFGDVYDAKQALEDFLSGFSSNDVLIPFQTQIDTAKEAFELQDAVVKGFKSTVTINENAWEEAKKAKAAIDANYYQNLLDIQKTYQDLYAKYLTDMTTKVTDWNKAALDQSFKDTSLTDILSLLKTYQDAVIIYNTAFKTAEDSNQVIDASAVTDLATATQNFKDGVKSIGFPIIAQAIAHLDTIASSAEDNITLLKGIKDANLVPLTKYQEELLEASEFYQKWDIVKDQVVIVLQQIITAALEKCDTDFKTEVDTADKNWQDNINTLAGKIGDNSKGGSYSYITGNEVDGVGDYPFTKEGPTGGTAYQFIAINQEVQVDGSVNLLMENGAYVLGLKGLVSYWQEKLAAATTDKNYYADFVALRTRKSTDLVKKQKELAVVQEELETLAKKLGQDVNTYCIASDANCGNDEDSLNMQKYQTDKVLLTKEVNDLAAEVTWLSNPTKVTEKDDAVQKAFNDATTELADATKNFDTEQDSYDINLQKLASFESEGDLQTLQDGWKEKLQPLIDTEQARCDAAEQVFRGFQGQLQVIYDQLVPLYAELKDWQKELNDLKALNCEASIFYTERQDELQAKINVNDARIKFLQIPLEQEANAVINYGLFALAKAAQEEWETYGCDPVDQIGSFSWPLCKKIYDADGNLLPTDYTAKTATGPACQVRDDLEARLNKFTTTKFSPQTVLTKQCVGPDSWDSVTFVAPVVPCISNPDDLVEETAKLLANVYDQENLDAFKTCTGLSFDLPDFGDQWTSKLVPLQPAIDNAQKTLEEFEKTLEPLQDQIDSKTSEAVDLRQQATDLDDRYKNEYTAFQTKFDAAVTINTCDVGQIQGILDSVPGYEARIVELRILQGTTYKSYWETEQSKWEDARDAAQTTYDDAVNAFKKDDTALFPVICDTPGTADVPAGCIDIEVKTTLVAGDEEAANQVDGQRRMLSLADSSRRLATYETNDLEMIDLLQANSVYGPSKIKICTGGDLITTYGGSELGIKGYQMIYGTGAKEMAGPAHGDVYSGCKDYTFPSSPVGVNFYYPTGTTDLEGMRVLFENPDSSSSIKLAINGGVVEKANQDKIAVTFDPADLTRQLFGFKTENDDEANNKILSSKVLNYDAAQFKKLIDEINNGPALIAAEQLSVDAAIAGIKEWKQIEIYQNVIQADVITGIEKVSASSTYVLRPAEAQEIRNSVKDQVKAIKSEQAAAEVAAAKATQAAIEAEAKRLEEAKAKVESGELPQHISDHYDQKNEANTGAIVAVIIGCLMLVGLIAVMVYKCVAGKRMREMNNARGGKQLVNQSSFRSENGQQRDDI